MGAGGSSHKSAGAGGPGHTTAVAGGPSHTTAGAGSPFQIVANTVGPSHISAVAGGWCGGGLLLLGLDPRAHRALLPAVLAVVKACVVEYCCGRVLLLLYCCIAVLPAVLVLGGLAVMCLGVV